MFSTFFPMSVWWPNQKYFAQNIDQFILQRFVHGFSWSLSKNFTMSKTVFSKP